MHDLAGIMVRALHTPSKRGTAYLLMPTVAPLRERGLKFIGLYLRGAGTPVCPVASKTGHTDSSHEDAISGRIVQPQPQTRRVQVHITQNEAILFVVLSRPDRQYRPHRLQLFEMPRPYIDRVSAEFAKQRAIHIATLQSFAQERPLTGQRDIHRYGWRIDEPEPFGNVRKRPVRITPVQRQDTLPIKRIIADVRAGDTTISQT